MLRRNLYSAYQCARCSPFNPLNPRLPFTLLLHPQSTRHSSSQNSSSTNQNDSSHEERPGIAQETKATENEAAQEDGAMSRRLRELTEESLETSGRRASKAVSEAGFSEELRVQLEERIAAANFRNEHRNAFAEAELPSTAGRASRDIATANPWTGSESIHDANLRMLNDAHKPLRGTSNRTFQGPANILPRSVDTGRKPKGGDRGTRLANARDRSGLYSSLKESESISDKEREQRLQELKDRFSPHARSIVPGTITGLASLANERIEDAISRGQFKNLPRGKQIERDYTASSPFLDTTEYFLNKMIQKQEIVPPWIEKQQELGRAAEKFRRRLRAEWRRHAARMIARGGGTLLEQMGRAKKYAEAEARVNPAASKRLRGSGDKAKNTATGEGEEHMSQISLSGELSVPSPSPSSSPSSSSSPPESTSLDNTSSPASLPQPFRDPAWLATESSYLNLSIQTLNSQTRTYNLLAPDLAKKPYFSLDRELDACYADVAPQLAEAIKERALAPKARGAVLGTGAGGGKGGGVLEGLVGAKVRVRDERVEKRYGVREFWRDVFGGRKG